MQIEVLFVGLVGSRHPQHPHSRIIVAEVVQKMLNEFGLIGVASSLYALQTREVRLLAAVPLVQPEYFEGLEQEHLLVVDL